VKCWMVKNISKLLFWVSTKIIIRIMIDSWVAGWWLRNLQGLFLLKRIEVTTFQVWRIVASTHLMRRRLRVRARYILSTSRWPFSKLKALRILTQVIQIQIWQIFKDKNFTIRTLWFQINMYNILRASSLQMHRMFHPLKNRFHKNPSIYLEI
jgi:hypothetical protein